MSQTSENNKRSSLKRGIDEVLATENNVTEKMKQLNTSLELIQDNGKYHILCS